jgi:hypothetical protein
MHGKHVLLALALSMSCVPQDPANQNGGLGHMMGDEGPGPRPLGDTDMRSPMGGGGSGKALHLIVAETGEDLGILIDLRSVVAFSERLNGPVYFSKLCAIAKFGGYPMSCEKAVDGPFMLKTLLPVRQGDYASGPTSCIVAFVGKSSDDVEDAKFVPRWQMGMMNQTGVTGRFVDLNLVVRKGETLYVANYIANVGDCHKNLLEAGNPARGPINPGIIWSGYRPYN